MFYVWTRLYKIDIKEPTEHSIGWVRGALDFSGVSDQTLSVRERYVTGRHTVTWWVEEMLMQPCLKFYISLIISLRPA